MPDPAANNTAYLRTVGMDRRSDNSTLFIITAPEPPRKWIASSQAGNHPIITVTVTGDTPFVPQRTMPEGVSSEDTYGFIGLGFLMIKERVFAVGQSDLDRFTVVGEWRTGDPNRDGEWPGGNAVLPMLELLEVHDTDGAAIKVRQVWIEPDTIGRAMLRLLCSTGTEGYNIPLYDDMPASMGVGFPSSLIDIAAILQMSDAPYMIVLTEPTPFVKLFESALNVIGKHAVWGNGSGGGGGKLTIISPFESASAENLIALTEANKARPITADDAGKPVTDPVLLGRVDVDDNPETITNRCTLQYHPGLKSGWLRRITVNAMASQSDYDQVSAAVVDGYGIYDGATELAPAAGAWERDVVGAALAYFAEPVSLARRSYNFNLATRLHPGAKVVVSDDGMIDPTTGEYCVDGLLGWAVETEFDWMTGIGQIAYCYQPASATVTGATKLGVLAPSARIDETFDFASAFDSETAAMYRFNETSVTSGYATAADASGNGRDLSEDLIGSGSSDNYTHIINGPGGKVAGKYARWFPGVVDGAHLTRAADAEGNDCFNGAGWSVEAWVLPILGVAGMKVFTYQLGVSVDPLYMAMADVTIDAIGRVGVYWETSATSSGRSPILEYSTDALPDEEWSHLAVTVDRSGATATVKFYLDGQLNRTVSGVTKSASGTGGYNVGHQPGSAGAFHGAIGDLRVSTIVRTAAEIAASASDPDFEHALDDACLLLLRFDEAPDAIEESEYGYHARLLSGTVQIVSPLAPDGGQARDMAGPSYYIAHAGYAPIQEALAGDWSFDCWTDFHTGYSAAINALWRFGGSGETAATNATVLSLDTARKLKTAWEHGSGTDDSKTTTAAIFAAAGDGEIVHHLAVVFWSSGGVYHLEVYLDGVLLESLTPTSRPDGATTAWLMFGYDGTSTMNAVMDDLRWSSVRRTASEIADIYAGGWASGYNSLSKTLQLKPHEYSTEDEDVDMAWFVATDEVHIVDLSPADPDAPDEWDDTVASVDEAQNRITLTTGLAGWPDRGHFVIEGQGKAADTTSQRIRSAVIADDTTRSTGVSDNDANVWGGDPLSADAALEQDIVYRRWNRGADDVGEPLSVHKLHELRDWANTALVSHTAPVFLSEIYATPVSFTGDGTSEILLGPPLWIPLYAGGARSIEVRFLASMGTDTDGGATLRAVTSTSLPTDDGDFLEPTWDVSYALATAIVAESDDYAWYTATVTVPVQVSGLVPGCWLAVSVLLDDAAAGVINLRALHVAEVTP